MPLTSTNASARRRLRIRSSVQSLLPPAQSLQRLSRIDSPSVSPSSLEPGRDPQTLLVYWESQWRRNAEFEQQRLQVSNFVIAASVIALGLMARTSTKPSTWVIVVVGAAVALSNVMGILYSWRSSQWARLHKARAKAVLVDNWDYLADLQAKVDVKAPRPHGKDNLLRREMLQRYIHGILSLAAILLAIYAVARP